MTYAFRRITKRVFIIIHIVISFLFLLACCNAFLSPQHWWFIALLGLAFPFLLALVAAFLIFWLIFRSRWALLSLVCLLLGYSNIRALVGLHFGKEFTESKPAGALRVLTWNVTWFDEQTKTNRPRGSYRKEMFEYLQAQDADVVCFQEYLEPNSKRLTYNNRHDLTALGYPYSMVAIDYIGWKGTFQSGIAIFSKHPILDSIHIRYPGPKNFRAAESLIGVDINHNGQKVRVFTTHLQSVMFQANDYRNIELIKSGSDSLYEASKNVVRKLALGYNFRGQQVDIVSSHLKESPYPAVICGDFNDVPNSYTYFRIRGDRKDAFREAGKGIGRTFANLAPTLRIDYIMADKRFEVLQYKRDILPYSEHYPVIADLRLPDTGD